MGLVKKLNVVAQEIFLGRRFTSDGKRVYITKTICQIDNGEPFMSIGNYDEDGKYIRSSIRSLSKKEATFYRLPELNKREVKHL